MGLSAEVDSDSRIGSPPTERHAQASYKRQVDNKGITDFVSMPKRGHSLTIDGGWREVADTALGFVKRLLQPRG